MKELNINLRFFALMLFSILLAGCQSTPRLTLSPEQAAIAAATSPLGGRAAVVDPQTVQVLQSQTMDESTFVMVHFEQFFEGRQEKCLFMYETSRESLGTWRAHGGGGGCSSGQMTGGGTEPLPPLEMGGGSSGGGQLEDPSFSYANGMVNQADIAQVRVTWDDGQVQVVPVINASYLALRSGAANIKTVEGLDADGGVVTSNSMDAAPGKAP